MNRLDLLGYLLVGGFLAAAAWTASFSYLLQYGSFLLVSLLLAALVFVRGVLWRRGNMVLYSWIWLAADNVLAQALRGSEASIFGSVASVLFFLVVIDTNEFLRRIRPAARTSEGTDPGAYKQNWSLLKARFGRTFSFAVFAGALVVIGFGLGGPVLASPNPVLLTAAISFLLLTLTLVITSRTGSS